MRKHCLIVALVIAAFAAGGTSSSAYAGPRTGPPEPAAADPAQETFKLICRGGGSLTTQRGGPVPDANGVEMVVIVVRFARSTGGAGAKGKGLKPGQCSWIDRRVNSREPTELRFKVPLHATPPPGTGGKSSTAAERAADAFTVPEYLESKDHYYIFSAFNSPMGHLRATDSRFFKP